MDTAQLSGSTGFEPMLTGPKPVVLPLHNDPKKGGIRRPPRQLGFTRLEEVYIIII